MLLRWQTLFLAVSAIIMKAHTAVMPTQDLLVITHSEKPTTVSTILQELTTEDPRPPIKVTEMKVVSEISMRYAHTTVETRVRNPAKYAQEATFRLLLSRTAFISEFFMILDGKSYKAFVNEKKEAQEKYNEAVSQGKGAAHVAAKARDSNHFTVSVNVEPNTTAVFNLKYEELLERRNGVYNHAVNLHPGMLVPKMSVVIKINETEKITLLRVPEMRTGNEIDATEKDAQNPKAVIVRGEHAAKVIFTPDLDEQERLIQIYADKSKESAVGAKDGILGQFVVQYDVDRPLGGQVLVNDGYFVHFFAPSDLPPLRKHVVFVLDTSGSMMGRKIEQLVEAMHVILDMLNDGDYFNIVDFNWDAKVHDVERSNSAVSELVAPSVATDENIAKAKSIVSKLMADGGTNIYSALDVAVKLVQMGTGKFKPDLDSTSTIPEPNIEATTIQAVELDGNGEPIEPSDSVTLCSSYFSKTQRHQRLNYGEPESIVIFLTDGDPTEGETNTELIIDHVTKMNSGPRMASIFTLAFGEDAQREFLHKLSLLNAGFMRHIYEAADAALQLRDFYRQVASPLLADLHFVYPNDQVNSDSLTRCQFPKYYKGSETVMAGQVAAGAALTPQVIAVGGDAGPGLGMKNFAATPKVVPNASGYLSLERLWAYLTIKQLLDIKDAADVTAKDTDNAKKKALDIAMKYNFVTPLTSLVVVTPNATHAVNLKSVDDKDSQQQGNWDQKIQDSIQIETPTEKKLSKKAGSSFKMHCKATPKADIKWYFQSSHIDTTRTLSAEEDGSLNIHRVRVYDEGLYTCEASNAHDAAYLTYELTVEDSITLQPPAEKILKKKVGSSFEMPCKVDGDPKPSIKWIFQSKNPNVRSKRMKANKDGSLHLNMVQVYEEGLYTCVASNIFDTIDITYEVIVLEPPSILPNKFGNTVVAIDGDVMTRIPCEARGNPAPEITWTRHNHVITIGTDFYDADKNALILKNVNMTSAGYYKCRATNSEGSDINTVKLNVLSSPNRYVNDLVTNTFWIEYGIDEFEVPCSLQYKPIAPIQWYMRRKRISGGNLILRNITFAHDGVYTCRLYTPLGYKSADVKVNVGHKPRFVYEDEDITYRNFEEDKSKTLDCEVQGVPNPKVTWWHDGRVLNITDTTLKTNIPGEYRCNASNELGYVERKIVVEH